MLALGRPQQLDRLAGSPRRMYRAPRSACSSALQRGLAFSSLRGLFEVARPGRAGRRSPASARRRCCAASADRAGSRATARAARRRSRRNSSTPARKPRSCRRALPGRATGFALRRCILLSLSDSRPYGTPGLDRFYRSSACRGRWKRMKRVATIAPPVRAAFDLDGFARRPGSRCPASSRACGHLVPEAAIDEPHVNRGDAGGKREPRLVGLLGNEPGVDQFRGAEPERQRGRPAVQMLLAVDPAGLPGQRRAGAGRQRRAVVRSDAACPAPSRASTTRTRWRSMKPVGTRWPTLSATTVDRDTICLAPVASRVTFMSRQRRSISAVAAGKVVAGQRPRVALDAALARGDVGHRPRRRHVAILALLALRPAGLASHSE